MATEESKKLTPPEAAEHVGLSAAQLAKLRMTGEGPAFFKLGRKVMYALGDLNAWLASKRLTKAPPGRGKGEQRSAGTLSAQHVAA